MEQQEKSAPSPQQDEAVDMVDWGGANQTMNGSTVTQEQMSDAYKLGTIEEQGSTR